MNAAIHLDDISPDTATHLDDISPDTAWSLYVGDQSVAEFVILGATPESYVHESPACDDLSEREGTKLIVLLTRHITSQT